ncbi:MAG: putative glycoside hydrolase [Actinomycetota bacterium]|nr:putative glycoside hydrolase [Actinomycetota bacterium]
MSFSAYAYAHGRLRLAAALLLTALVVGCSAASGELPPEQADDLPPPGAEDQEAEASGASGLPKSPDIVRGVYSHPSSFWGDNWSNLIRLVQETELNAIVVDVKDESGTLLWNIDHPLAEAGGGAKWRDNYEGLEGRLQMLKDAGGWAIARIACFKDTRVADARPDLAVQNQSGKTWKARKNFSWLNPYQDEAGQWCIDVALAALEVGFDEIQYDYIRFPNAGDGVTTGIQLPGVPPDRPRDAWRHSDEIVDFLARATEQIHKAGGYISADLFGLVTYDFRWDAGGTGQVLERIAEHVDFISLMVYPSHYNAGNYGLKPHPIRYPYETVWNAMQEAQMRVQGLHAQIRPWLEDFSAPWMGYPNHTPKHVTEQIRAAYENGINGWLLWNAGNRYTESILERGEAVSHANESFRPPARTANPDPAPGTEPRNWPGMPPCDPYPGVLQIGLGNLAGSKPPQLALPHDDPRLCGGVPNGEEATTPWWERQNSAGGAPAPAEAP